MISLNEFFSNTNPVIVAFLNSSGVVWTENFGLRFQSKTSAFKSGVLWTEPNQLFSFIFFVWSSTSGRQLSGEWRNHEMKFLISNPVNCSDPINKWNQHYSWISVNKLNWKRNYWCLQKILMSFGKHFWSWQKHKKIIETETTYIKTYSLSSITVHSYRLFHSWWACTIFIHKLCQTNERAQHKGLLCCLLALLTVK